MPEIKQRVKQLRQQLQKADYTYYVLDNPIMEDAVYDRLYRELEELEQQHPELVTPDSPTQRVGGEPAQEFQEVRHNIPLYSLENAFSLEELTKWQERWQRQVPDVESFEYVCELKLDGSALALTYENGILHDGIIEDIVSVVCLLQLLAQLFYPLLNLRHGIKGYGFGGCLNLYAPECNRESDVLRYLVVSI